MVISHDDDKLLVGDGNKEQIVHVLHHGTEANVVGSCGDPLRHRNGFFVENVKVYLRVMLMV